jgi:PAS domain S-box-containing protein
MPPGNESKALVSTLVDARARVAERARGQDQQRLIGPILSEIDRVVAALEPREAAAAKLTSLEGTVPAPERDVEALRREVERLRALVKQDRGLLETVLNHSPHGILVSDPQGKLTIQNRAAERIWAGSATADNVDGWGRYRAFHEDGRPYEPGDWAMARALSSGETVDAEEVHFQRFDGTHGVLLGSAAPVYGPDGVIAGAVSTFADITRFKQMERDLRLRDAWLATTLRSIADGVVATDALGRIEFMNAVAEDLLRVTISDAARQNLDEILDVVDDVTGVAHEAIVRRVLREGAPIEVANALLRCRGGGQVAIDQSCAPLRNEAGDLIGAVLVLRDVTERRSAEARRRFIAEASWVLASSALDYEGTVTSVAGLGVPRLADWCMVDIVEVDGSLQRAAVTHVDRERLTMAAKLTQRSPPVHAPAALPVLRGETAGYAAHVVEELVAVADDPSYAALLRALPEGAAISVPLRARDRVLGAMTFVCAESGGVFGPDDAALAHQLGNSAALAIDNARLYREAQRVNRVKDEFLATLSHELRTPLNAILGWARLLRMGKLDAAAHARALETIERNALSQAQLIEDLLDVSRIISGKFRVEVRTVDMPSVTEAAIDAVRLAAESKGIEIVPQIDAVPMLAGDPTRLQQVVWNLLSNAIKFTPKGGRVDVRLACVESHVELEVADNGPGISADFLPYVFDRFRQADGTTTRTHSGLGLGLAIVRHLVELHGGSVRALSEGEGQGAVFAVRLPVAAVRPRSPDDALLDGAGHGAPVGARPLCGIHVLVVDDETDARELVAAVLTEAGATVTAVGSAREAIAAIETARPDVLVSDIGMPAEDGYSLIRRIRAMEKSVGRIPAAALTAYASVQDRTRALLAGYSSHLPKPVEPAELTAVVANLAGRPPRG